MRIKSKLNHAVELITNDEQVTLKLNNFELLGRSLKCTVAISSRGFGFNSSVYFDNVQTFLSDLEAMHSTLTGSAELKEDYKDHFIKFELNDLGHVIVSASFVEYSEFSQSLAIEFKTDQTCLSPFIEEFKVVLL